MTKSQAVAGNGRDSRPYTASSISCFRDTSLTFWGHVTSSVTWHFDSP